MKKWQTLTTSTFDQWFAQQNETVQIEITANVKVLEKIGPALGRPIVDTLNSSKYANMKELRVRVDKQVIRIAFAFDPKQTGIFLTAGAKQGKNENRFYKALIKQADRLYAQHLEHF